MAYSLRPVTRADLAMLGRWLTTTEVARWWGDPVEQFNLLLEDLGNPDMVMRIVSYHGTPFAYCQHYDVHRWPQPHLALLPVGSRAIDNFIGEPAMIGFGHGSTFLWLLTKLLRAQGAPIIAVDPAVANTRARRAYQKAGFADHSVIATSDGPVVLMLCSRTGNHRGWQPAD
ncbi:MAG TPA: GNAT family N-acetyltransferase [Acetobacteraceae bacterium]|nr:GNAT family N-acetyltransferase [Acetobacteraceae bacterium]